MICAWFWILHTNGIITPHIHTLDTFMKWQEDPIENIVFWKKSDSSPMTCALSRILHLNTRCTRRGSLLFLQQLKYNFIWVEQIDLQEARKTTGVNTKKFLGKKTRQMEAKANVNMINNFYHKYGCHLSKDKEIMVLLRGGIL